MKPLHNLLIRYTILVAVAIPNLYIFYLIFTPLTTYPVYFLLDLFNISSTSIKIIPACIAASAYYLLLILNLATPNIKLKKRITLIISAFATFLIINLLRIIFLTILYNSNSPLFNFTHLFFWYFLSTIFVLTIWFTQVKIYKIKSIPFYSDIKFLLNKK